MDQIVKAGYVRFEGSRDLQFSLLPSVFFLGGAFWVLVGEGLGSPACSSPRLFSAPSEYSSQLRLPFLSDKLLHPPVTPLPAGSILAWERVGLLDRLAPGAAR